MKNKPKPLNEEHQIKLILSNFKDKDRDLVPMVYMFEVYNLYPTAKYHELHMAVMTPMSGN